MGVGSECQVVDVRAEKSIKIKTLRDEKQVLEDLTEAPSFKQGNYKTGK